MAVINTYPKKTIEPQDDDLIPITITNPRTDVPAGVYLVRYSVLKAYIAAQQSGSSVGDLWATSSTLPISSLTEGTNLTNTWTLETGVQATTTGINLYISTDDPPDGTFGFWIVSEVGGTVVSKVLIPWKGVDQTGNTSSEHSFILPFSASQDIRAVYVNRRKAETPANDYILLKGGSSATLPATSVVKIHLANAGGGIITETDPTVNPIAKIGNTDVWPASKLPSGLGGLDESEVDARIQIWGRASNADTIPRNKLPPTGGVDRNASRTADLNTLFPTDGNYAIYNRVF